MDVVDDFIEVFWQRQCVILLQVARFAIGESGDRSFVNASELPLLSEARKAHEAIFALILERIGDADATYRRIGVAKMPKSGSEELGWEMKTVTIL